MGTQTTTPIKVFRRRGCTSCPHTKFSIVRLTLCSDPPRARHFGQLGGDSRNKPLPPGCVVTGA